MRPLSTCLLRGSANSSTFLFLMLCLDRMGARSAPSVWPVSHQQHITCNIEHEDFAHSRATLPDPPPSSKSKKCGRSTVLVTCPSALTTCQSTLIVQHQESSPSLRMLAFLGKCPRGSTRSVPPSKPVRMWACVQCHLHAPILLIDV